MPATVPRSVGAQPLLGDARERRAARERVEVRVADLENAGDRNLVVGADRALGRQAQAPFDRRHREHEITGDALRARFAARARGDGPLRRRGDDRFGAAARGEEEDGDRGRSNHDAHPEAPASGARERRSASVSASGGGEEPAKLPQGRGASFRARRARSRIARTRSRTSALSRRLTSARSVRSASRTSPRLASLIAARRSAGVTPRAFASREHSFSATDWRRPVSIREAVSCATPTASAS